LPPPPPAARPSPSAGARRRKVSAPLTKKDLIKERAEKRRVNRAQKEREGSLEQTGVRVRGRWVATPTRRQTTLGLGPAFDGSQGVDSQDILGIPQISLSTFQLFPDQNIYTPSDPNLSSFNNSVQAGTEWIKNQIQNAQPYGKPVVCTGFGLVTQNNAPDFVPFNSTLVANSLVTSHVALKGSSSSPFVTDSQRNQAYQQWLQAGIKNGIDGMLQYQWSQGHLMVQSGTDINTPNSNGAAVAPPSGNGVVPPTQGQAAISPNDGYATSGTGQNAVQNVIKKASQNIGAVP